MQKRSVRGPLLVATALACLPSLAGAEPPPQATPPTPPSLVLLLVDTLRADRLGAWGYPHPTSPVIDDLASQGVRFSHYYANCSWTRPSIAAILTGLYPRETGIYEERWDSLAAELETLPEILHGHGYATLGVTANPTLNGWFGFDQGFDEYLGSSVVWKHMEPQRGQRRFQPGAVEMDDAETVTDRALALVDGHPELAHRPLYLQVLYIDPHDPRKPPAADLDRVRESGSKTAAYDGEVRFVDSQIGRLLAELRKRGRMSDTLVVVTSDHGEGLSDHPKLSFATGHGRTLYDSVLHIPLVLHHPKLSAGRVVSELASTIDLLPTLLDLLGLADAAERRSGRSLGPLVRGEALEPATTAVFSETDFRIHSKQSVRTRDHKLIRNLDSAAYRAGGAFEGRELSDKQREMLEALPAEELYPVGTQERPLEGDVGASRVEAEPAVTRRLAESLDGWNERVPRRPPLRHDPEDAVTLGDGSVISSEGEAGEAPDPDTIERLKALGYLVDDE